MILIYLLDIFLNPKLENELLTEEEQAKALDVIMSMADKNNLKLNDILQDLADFKAKEGIWLQKVIWKAVETCTELTWWKAFCGQRELCKIAIIVLSTPSTSAACERNWNTFSFIKSKKRNRLSIDRTNKLVGIKFNLDLITCNEFNEKVKVLMKENKEVQEVDEERKTTDNDLDGEDSDTNSNESIIIYEEDDNENFSEDNSDIDELDDLTEVPQDEQ